MTISKDDPVSSDVHLETIMNNKLQKRKRAVAHKRIKASISKGQPLKDPEGGLTAAGREKYNRETGSNLKPGVTGAADTPEKMRRKGSFLTRFFTNPSGPMVNDKGEPTRLALSANAWGEPVPKNRSDAATLAEKGRKLLERYKSVSKGESVGHPFRGNQYVGGIRGRSAPIDSTRPGGSFGGGGGWKSKRLSEYHSKNGLLLIRVSKLKHFDKMNLQSLSGIEKEKAVDRLLKDPANYKNGVIVSDFAEAQRQKEAKRLGKSPSPKPSVVAVATAKELESMKQQLEILTRQQERSASAKAEQIKLSTGATETGISGILEENANPRAFKKLTDENFVDWAMSHGNRLEVIARVFESQRITSSITGKKFITRVDDTIRQHILEMSIDQQNLFMDHLIRNKDGKGPENAVKATMGDPSGWKDTIGKPFIPSKPLSKAMKNQQVDALDDDEYSLYARTPASWSHESSIAFALEPKLFQQVFGKIKLSRQNAENSPHLYDDNGKRIKVAGSQKPTATEKRATQIAVAQKAQAEKDKSAQAKIIFDSQEEAASKETHARDFNPDDTRIIVSERIYERNDRMPDAQIASGTRPRGLQSGGIKDTNEPRFGDINVGYKRPSITELPSGETWKKQGFDSAAQGKASRQRSYARWVLKNKPKLFFSQEFRDYMQEAGISSSDLRVVAGVGIDDPRFNGVSKGDLVGHPFYGNQYVVVGGKYKYAVGGKPKNLTQEQKNAQLTKHNRQQAERYDSLGSSFNHDEAQIWATTGAKFKKAYAKNLTDKQIKEFLYLSPKDLKCYLDAPEKMSHADIMKGIKSGANIREVSAGFKAVSAGAKGLAEIAKFNEGGQNGYIPPGWSMVHIATSAKGKVSAKGIDIGGKEQSAQPRSGVQQSSKEKHSKVEAAGKAIRSLGSKALSESARSDEASVSYLLTEVGMRIGSPKQLGAVAVTGATTLQVQHITIKGSQVTFSFVGKKGVDISGEKAIVHNSPQLAAMLKKRMAGKKPGENIFNTSEVKVNGYIKKTSGVNISAKDIRTHVATTYAEEIFRKAFSGINAPTDNKSARAARAEIGRLVSLRLGNRPSEALSSYINATVFAPLSKKFGSLTGPAPKKVK